MTSEPESSATTPPAPSRVAGRVKVWHVLAYCGIVALLLFVFVGFRTLLFQTFNVPSTSMEPTLLIGDYFFVSKFSYGYSRFSLPFSANLFSGRIFGAEPHRGDVVVFRLPKDTSIDYVKRIIGLPGDRVQMIQGQININGVAIKRQRMDDFIDTDESGGVTRIKRWRETLPNGVSYETLDLLDNGFYDNTPVFEVPPGNYFVLGDNLDNSVDSRVTSQVGYVPFENLVGRATAIFWSMDPAGDVRSERVGKAIQ